MMTPRLLIVSAVKALNAVCLLLARLVILRAKVRQVGIDMFRIKICYHINNGHIRARLTSRNVIRTVHVGDKCYLTNNKDRWNEFIYQLCKKCREMSRDELLIKHGKRWRKHEQSLVIIKSANSAIKRMQPVEIKRY